MRTPCRNMRAVLAMVVSCLALPIGAHAASFVVNGTEDAGDANPGDGICATAIATCTLRAAIQEANAQPDADSITVPAGTVTLTGAAGDDAAESGDLDILGPVAISGQGPAATIIDAGKIDRVFDVIEPTATVSIASLTVRNGFSGAGFPAGGIW